ncbi:SGNH/GDSL hydrolase family protein [Rhodocytophaga aerolata]|uniref:SGNH/GDSL hydrolase family protein n=1 Tax=Rhodocytophaga aerolata TaxID=455078 RepID=A0ABT8R2U4_9BACT|nr:SGNH/GDSL hydrolase family protein [Rhodocytophaga aerolata]MDO1445513.1 SGNH/GDSL hydrolase family protein [Rhodocytophaga aerolata]
MVKRIGPYFLLVILMMQTADLFAQPIAPTVKRIVFLGNSITWAGNYVNYLEAYIRARHPDRQLEFINVGLPSETVSGLSEEGHADGKFPRPDLHERLSRVLQQTKPDMVFACYGMNDGIYLPFNEQRFAKFKEGIHWLHAEIEKTGARLIHMTPPDYDELRGKKEGYAAVLDRYTDWLLSKKTDSRWEVVDIHYPMKKYLQAHRQVDATFGLHGFALADDGVHPGETGHWLIAREILQYLGYKEVAKAADVVESLSQIGDAPQLVKLVTQRQNLMRDAWLTETKHKRPGLPTGLPLSEAMRKSNELMQSITTILQQK